MTVTPPPTLRTSPPPSEPPDDEDVDFDELAGKIVMVTGLRKPRVHRGLLVGLGVIAAVCVLATMTRASAAPLIPLTGVTIAWYAAWRVRTAPTDRQILGHLTVYAVAVAVALLSMSYVTRTLL